MGKETSYCNLKRPPDVVISSFDRLTISFYKGPDPWHKQYIYTVEGFRITYTAIEAPDFGIVDYKYNISKGKKSSSLFL
jgi:hypothetical protein